MNKYITETTTTTEAITIDNRGNNNRQQKQSITDLKLWWYTYHWLNKNKCRQLLFEIWDVYKEYTEKRIQVSSFYNQIQQQQQQQQNIENNQDNVGFKPCRSGLWIIVKSIVVYGFDAGFEPQCSTLMKLRWLVRFACSHYQWWSGSGSLDH